MTNLRPATAQAHAGWRVSSTWGPLPTLVAFTQARAVSPGFSKRRPSIVWEVA